MDKYDRRLRSHGLPVLSQKNGEHEHPIYYASKAFTKGEQNKVTIEQELIAIHWAIKKFRPYVYGTEFTVRSDHKPLVYLFSLKEPSSRLTRIRLDLEEYNFKVTHIKGKENVVADALSRRTSEELKSLSQNDYRPILALTRSMKNKEMVETSTKQIEKIIEPNDSEDIDNNKGIPILNSRYVATNPDKIQFYSHAVRNQ